MEPEKCIICLEEETDEKPLDGSCDDCSHVFHKECLNAWLVRNNICPLCRAPCTNEYSRRIKMWTKMWINYFITEFITAFKEIWVGIGIMLFIKIIFPITSPPTYYFRLVEEMQHSLRLVWEEPINIIVVYLMIRWTRWGLRRRWSGGAGELSSSLSQNQQATYFVNMMMRILKPAINILQNIIGGLTDDKLNSIYKYIIADLDISGDDDDDLDKLDKVDKFFTKYKNMPLAERKKLIREKWSPVTEMFRTVIHKLYTQVNKEKNTGGLNEPPSGDSKNLKCKTNCEETSSRGRCTCDTDPYSSYGMTWDWDYCDCPPRKSKSGRRRKRKEERKEERKRKQASKH